MRIRATWVLISDDELGRYLLVRGAAREELEHLCLPREASRRSSRERTLPQALVRDGCRDPQPVACGVSPWACLGWRVGVRAELLEHGAELGEALGAEQLRP